MKNLFDPVTVAEVKDRLATLQRTAQPLWGRMNVGQMMAHCAVGLESATGERVIPRVFIGRMLGGIVKPLALGDDKPMKRNSPTAPDFLIAGDRDLDAERAKVIVLIDRFAAAGASGCTKASHAFFGRMTPDEWSILMYKHLDHHLRQFGA